MAGRTVKKHTRVYVGGYDLSGYASSIGPLVTQFDAVGITCFTDPVQGVMNNQPTLSPGQLTGVFDNTATTGLHTLHAASAGSAHIVTVAIGDRAAPAEGDPVYTGKFAMDNYMADPGAGMVAATAQFGKWDAATLKHVPKSWGWLMHESSAETGANTAVGIDDHGAATALGGFMVYHVLAGAGSSTMTATITVEDASTNTNPNFAALTGATSGSIACNVVSSGIVATTATQAVKRYIRWQIALGTATSVTFVLAFVRRLF